MSNINISKLNFIENEQEEFSNEIVDVSNVSIEVVHQIQETNVFHQLIQNQNQIWRNEKQAKENQGSSEVELSQVHVILDKIPQVSDCYHISKDEQRDGAERADGARVDDENLLLNEDARKQDLEAGKMFYPSIFR